MVTEKKRAANARNATRSTGPRTSSGKTRAKLNAIVHGLRTVSPVLPTESAEDWNSFRTGVIATLAPSGALEAELSERVALLMWRMRRVIGFETAATAAEQDAAGAIARGEPGPPDSLALVGQFRPAPGQHSRSTVDRDLEHARSEAAVFATLRDAFRGLAANPPAPRIAGDFACWYFSEAALAASDSAQKYRADGHRFPRNAHGFLDAVGVPREWHAKPRRWGGWTGGVVLRGLEVLAEDAGMTAAVLIERVAQKADRSAEEQRRKAGSLEAERNELDAAAAEAEKAARAQTVLPSAPDLDKVMRYESHLSRQLSQTMHLLERLQATRAGAPPAPPAALDVTIEAGPRPLPRSD